MLQYCIAFNMERLTVPALKYELQKRALDCKGLKAVLVRRLTQALNDEGLDPDSYVSDFDSILHGATQTVDKSSDRDSADEGGVAPDDSASQVSKRVEDTRSVLSQGSRTSRQSSRTIRSDASLRIAQAAKTAELLARASMLKEKRDVEEQELQEMMKIKKMEADARRAQEEMEMKKMEVELKMRQKKEDLTLRTEIKEAEARVQAIDEEERILEGENEQQPTQRQHLNAEAAEFRPGQISAGIGTVPPAVERFTLQSLGSSHTDGRVPVPDSRAAFSHPEPAVESSSGALRIPVGLSGHESCGFGDHQGKDDVQHAGKYSTAFGAEEPQRMASDSAPFPGHSAAQHSDLTRALLVQQFRNTLPKLEVPKFNGSVTDFVPFIKAFDSMVGLRLDDDEEKLRYLEQFTVGEPREIVKGCLMLPAAEGYAQARARLQRRYGDERKMASALVDKLLSWPSVRHDDIKGLDKFSIFLTGCNSSMPTGASSARELDHPGLLRSVMDKLPPHLQERWRRTAVQIQDSGRIVVFEDLASFVEKEVKIASDPLFGRHINEHNAAKSYTHAKSDKAHKTSCLATNVAETSQKYKCWCCSEDHLLDDCPELQKQTPDGKREFLMKHALCFGCLRRGHRAADCKLRKFCKVCSGRHPTLLHEDRPASTKQTDSHRAPMEATVKNGAVDIVAGASKLQSGMSIIPVKVRVNGGKTVSTYAFLDNGSSASFCTQSLLQELEVRRTETAQLSLSTVDPNVTRVVSQIVTGMEVSDMSQTEFVSLPPVYSLQKIPVTPEDIPKQREVRAWSHLHDIDIPEIDAEIGLMIGNDVPEVMEPWDIVHGQSPGEPFAVRTKVGWVVNGPVKTAKRSTIQVHRVGIGDADVHQMFVNMYNEDVQDTSSLDEKGMSREDHEWMEHVSSSCTRTESGHYEISLPFKENNPALPCNRHMATQRLTGLKRKLTADEELHGMVWYGMYLGASTKWLL